MNIGELFVTLGFKIEGGADLDRTVDKLDKSAAWAGKAALAIGAFTTAMGYMLKTALDATVGLQKFEVVTGLSADKLQQWNYRAALANVSAKEMMDTVEKIQQTGIKVATTGEGAQPWVLLGIDPRQNPFTVLDQLSNELQSVDVKRRALARSIVEQAGLGRDIFQMLVRPDPGPLPSRFVFSESDRAKMEAMNAEWVRLGFLTGQVKNRFSSELAPALREVIILLERGVNAAAKLVDWLGNHPRVAKGIAELAIALSSLGVVLASYAAAAKLAAIAMPALASGFAGVGVAALSLLVTLNAIVEAYKFIQRERKTNNETAEFIERNRGFVPGQHKQDNYVPHNGLRDLLRDLHNFVRPAAPASAGSNSLSQSNTFNIHESNNPARTKGVVTDALGAQLTTAGFSAEPGGY